MNMKSNYRCIILTLPDLEDYNGHGLNANVLNTKVTLTVTFPVMTPYCPVTFDII